MVLLRCCVIKASSFIFASQPRHTLIIWSSVKLFIEYSAAITRGEEMEYSGTISVKCGTRLQLFYASAYHIQNLNPSGQLRY